MKGRTMAWAVAFLVAAGLPAHATTVTRVFPFTDTTGYQPLAPLLQASDGNFYGTTAIGGDDGTGCINGCGGTVFKLTPQGQYTVLHTFAWGSAAAPWANGHQPQGGLVEGPDGYLYGTTYTGGYQFSSYGIIYKISKSGDFLKLHDMCPVSPCPDGANPQGLLAVGPDGYLYGTTTTPIIAPRIFRISTTGNYAAVASFFNTSMGTPQNGMILATDGNFYGATNVAIYRFTPGVGLTPMHIFVSSEGISGNGPLIQAADGNLYGVMYEGGAHSAGTVFKMSLAGDFQKILDLTGAVEGVYPNGLVQAPDGTLWGTTSNTGGANLGGAVYSISTAGAFLQATFLTATTGLGSKATLLLASDGKLYGTTSASGPNSGGTIFVVDAGLAPPFPGEAGTTNVNAMRVTTYDKIGGDVTVTYGGACLAADHHIVYGPLSNLATYGYTGQACNLGNVGTATFNPGSGSAFWVIVGNTATVEGSYGHGAGGAQRPEAVGLAGCDYVQNLSTTCP